MKRLNPATPPHTVSTERLKAVVLDWAGTTVDFGSVAPARTLQRLFASKQIELTEQEVRRDMGLPKREHIRGILAMPRIRKIWAHVHGHPPTEHDVDETYAEFIPIQFSCLTEYSAIIPGVVEAVESLRSRGLKVGSTTGYTREMLDVLLDSSATQRYKPDCHVTPGEVGLGRPHPFMMYECAIRLQVYPMLAIAKVGDTPADVAEGLNAGAWSIGVAATGNGIGLSLGEFESLPGPERAAKLEGARAELQRAGAHYVIDSLAELPAVLDAIDEQIREAHHGFA